MCTKEKNLPYWEKENVVGERKCWDNIWLQNIFRVIFLNYTFFRLTSQCKRRAHIKNKKKVLSKTNWLKINLLSFLRQAIIYVLLNRGPLPLLQITTNPFIKHFNITSPFVKSSIHEILHGVRLSISNGYPLYRLDKGLEKKTKNCVSRVGDFTARHVTLRCLTREVIFMWRRRRGSKSGSTNCCAYIDWSLVQK